MLEYSLGKHGASVTLPIRSLVGGYGHVRSMNAMDGSPTPSRHKISMAHVAP